MKPFVKSINIAKVAAGDNDPIRDLPIKLLQNLNSSNAGAVGPGGAADAGIEEVAPVLAVELLEGGHVVLDVEEAAGLRAVNDLIEGVGLGGGRVGVEGDVAG
ncbi:hypothetical protein Ahy_B08g094347 [Arachis hypogaea]|uniref:Uncharacterized protein n=1 Tax=Arachis hypogaea TaxID=3818 RepID=A0A444Y8P1_ARAHY|nr:hypothetical protein Ahy_B08g094347 [Arachis hypogaea]